MLCKKKGKTKYKKTVVQYHETHAAKAKSKRNSNKTFHQTNAFNIMKKTIETTTVAMLLTCTHWTTFKQTKKRSENKIVAERNGECRVPQTPLISNVASVLCKLVNRKKECKIRSNETSEALNFCFCMRLKRKKKEKRCPLTRHCKGPSRPEKVGGVFGAFVRKKRSKTPRQCKKKDEGNYRRTKK